MSGINISEQCHYVNLFEPDAYSSAASSEVFSMENWSHATIIVHKGAGSACTFRLEECTAFAGTGHRTFLPYTYTAESTALGDTLSAAAAGTTAGVAITTGDGSVLIFEVDAAAMSDGYQYMRVFHDAATTTDWGALAFLSGGRYQKSEGATAIA